MSKVESPLGGLLVHSKEEQVPYIWCNMDYIQTRQLQIRIYGVAHIVTHESMACRPFLWAMLIGGLRDVQVQNRVRFVGSKEFPKGKNRRPTDKGKQFACLLLSDCAMKDGFCSCGSSSEFIIFVAILKPKSLVLAFKTTAYR